MEKEKYSKEEIIDALRMLKDICLSCVECPECPFYDSLRSDCYLETVNPSGYRINEENKKWEIVAKDFENFR